MRQFHRHSLAQGHGGFKIAILASNGLHFVSGQHTHTRQILEL
jgi:hypothetical protein